MKLPILQTFSTLATKPADVLTLGGAPRVHLLPKEVEEQRKARSVRRLLLTALAGVVSLVVVGVAIASLGLGSANSGQAIEKARSVALAAELNKYVSITSTQNALDDIKKVQPVATDGEILWTPFIGSLQATLPAGTTISDLIAKLDPASATSARGAANPLLNAHVATLSVTARGSQLSISAWLGNLLALKGVANVSPGTISRDPSGDYTADVDLLLNSDIVAHRFAKGN